MSISTKERLKFVFSVVDGLELACRGITLKSLISDCSRYLHSKMSDANEWQLEILNSMDECLQEGKNQKGVEERLRSINRHAETQPEKGALITDLAKRALTGELREGVECAGIKYFSIQMEQVFTGDLGIDYVWNQEWQRLNSRFHSSITECL